MKKILFLIILISSIGFTACGGGGDDPNNGGGDSDNGGTITYNVGDTGPGGGIIFYVDETGFTMTDDGSTAHYLEAAPANWNGGAADSTLVWSNTPSQLVKDATGEETAPDIGAGRKNTALMLKQDATAPAAKVCKDYTGGGKSDWFLPSQCELFELWRLYSVKGYGSYGGLMGSYYWSSSEDSASYAWLQGFGDGGQGLNHKANTFSVRAVRAFNP